MLKLLRKRIALLMTFLLCFTMADMSALITAYAEEIEETKETAAESDAEEGTQELTETSTEETSAAETVSDIEAGAFEDVADTTAELAEPSENESADTEKSPSAIVTITYENIGDIMALEEGDTTEDSGWEAAEEEEEFEHSYGDYALTYTLKYGNAVITGYTGELPSELEIPETIDEYTVTEIDAWAFGEENITSVVIPGTVTTIGEYAFYDCLSLTDIYLADSISEIGYHAFYNCDSLTDIVLPASLQEIPNGLFSDCDNLVSVQIPESVIKIGAEAFYWCYNLQNITIPKNVTEIGSYAFYGCDSFTDIVLPASLQVISNGLFSSCDNLVSVVIPDPVTVIGHSAFAYCSSLASIEIPESVESFGNYAFSGCISLKNIELPQAENIPEGMFYECRNLENVTLGSTVTSLGYRAFSGTSSLKAISIPETITSIETYAFADSGLSEIGFSGNAPEFVPYYDAYEDITDPNQVFLNDTLAVFYPAENPTWTEAVMQTYGGTEVEWIPWDPETEEIQGYIDVIEDSVDGENEIGIHVIGSGDDLVLECNLPLKYFVSVEIDGVTVDPSNYDLKSGSTVITFDSSFLDTLTPGTHTVTMNYNINGRKVAVKTLIVIQEKSGSSGNPSNPTSPSKPNTPDSSKPSNGSTETNNGTASASQNKVTMKAHLVDANGQPMYNYTLEIHSDPVSATLGSNGTASFKNIEVGDHTMYLKDQNGKVLADKAIKIVFDQSYSITGGDTIHVVKGRPFILHVKYDGEKLILLSVEGDQTPATGDTSTAPIWILLMAASAAGMVFAFTRKRKQNA